MSYWDPRLAPEVYRRAEANAWVRRVNRVSKHRYGNAPGGYVEVSADLRRPLARVLRSDGFHVYVDAERFVLPDVQVPRWVATVAPEGGKPARQVCYLSNAEIPHDQGLAEIHYITVRGVEGDPPAPGQCWQGDDLTEGLKLVQLICTRDYANQITVVDVRNYGGRISRNEPHLRMYAQVGRGRRTDIRFDRFPIGGGADYVVSPERKLQYLDNYVAANGGRLAGVHEYLDLRYDHLHVSIH
jgi:hypothetical protein